MELFQYLFYSILWIIVSTTIFFLRNIQPPLLGGRRSGRAWGICVGRGEVGDRMVSQSLRASGNHTWEAVRWASLSTCVCVCPSWCLESHSESPSSCFYQLPVLAGIGLADDVENLVLRNGRLGRIEVCVCGVYVVHTCMCNVCGVCIACMWYVCICTHGGVWCYVMWVFVWCG